MTWEAINTGLVGDALTVWSISASIPTMGAGLENLLVWAATADGLYKSTDGGDEWNRVTLTEPEVGVGEPSVAAVIASKLDEDTVYVLAYLISLGRSWIGKSVDGGENWAWLSMGYDYTGTIDAIIDYTHVKTRAESGTWTDLNLHLVSGEHVWCLYWYARGGYLLVGVSSGIWKRSGGSWSRFATFSGACTDMLELSDGTLAVIDNGVPAIKLYNASGSYLGSYMTPRGDREWGSSHYYDYCLAELGGVLFVGQQEDDISTGNIVTRIYRHFSGSTWILEYESGVYGSNWLAMRAIVEYDGDLWFSERIGQLRHRDDGTWPLDDGTHILPDTENDLVVIDGALYALVNFTGILRREAGGWSAMVNDGSYLGATRFCFDDTNWFIMQNDDPNLDVLKYDGGWNIETAHDMDEERPSGYNDLGVGKSIVARSAFGSSVLPLGARAHTIDLNADESFIYVCALDAGTSTPIVVKANTGLTSSTRVYDSGMGAFVGVSCDPNDADTLVIFGAMAQFKYLVSGDGGITFTDRTFSGWMFNDTVSCALRNIKDSDDVVVFLSTSGQAYQTADGGETWSKRSDTGITPSYGARYLGAARKIYSGSASAGDPEMERSTDTAATWSTNQPTTTYGVNAITTAVT